MVAGWSWTGLQRRRESRRLAAEAAELDVAQVPDRQAAAGSLMPLEGKALAIASAVVKPAPVNGEPTLRHPLGPRTPEKGGVRLPR
jgi:hypothetical protein